MSSLVVCCPTCRQRAELAPATPSLIGGGVSLHWFEDGTQCPGVWPAYVREAPQPERRRPVSHPVPRRRRR